MAWASVPWLVGGGAEHSPEVARLLAYAALGGSEGVVGVDDCKVSALATPGASIRVAPGGAVMLNRSPGGGQQTYVGRCETEDVVPVTATGAGSTRYDLVIVRVEDPQYPPWPTPADPAVGPYIKTFIVTNVPSTTETAAELDLDYPAIALARLAIPPSTSTITSTMITDVRKVARPRRERFIRTTSLEAAETDELASTLADGEAWPDASAAWTMDVPEWATVARVFAVWSGVRIAASSNYFGSVWAKVGTVNTQTTGWEAPTVGTVQRLTFTSADDIAIPAAERGTTVQVQLRGRVSSGTAGGKPTLDANSSISMDVEFYEDASQS